MVLTPIIGTNAYNVLSDFQDTFPTYQIELVASQNFVRLIPDFTLLRFRIVYGDNHIVTSVFLG